MCVRGRSGIMMGAVSCVSCPLPPVPPKAGLLGCLFGPPGVGLSASALLAWLASPWLAPARPAPGGEGVAWAPGAAGLGSGGPAPVGTEDAATRPRPHPRSDGATAARRWVGPWRRSSAGSFPGALRVRWHRQPLRVVLLLVLRTLRHGEGSGQLETEDVFQRLPRGLSAVRRYTCVLSQTHVTVRMWGPLRTQGAQRTRPAVGHPVGPPKPKDAASASSDPGRDRQYGRWRVQG